MSAPIAKRPPAAFFTLVTDQWTKPFWEAAARHRLVAPRCAECGQFRMPPTPFCPNCQSQNIEWVMLSGVGTIFSYTVISRAILPGMEDSIPYVPAIATLEGAGGTRLITAIVDAPIDRVHVGGAVHVVWDTGVSGVVIPRFILGVAEGQ